MPFSHLILCRPLLLLPPLPPSIRIFSNESVLRMRCPKYWSFSFSIIPFKEIPGLIFRMDWLSPCSPRDSQEPSPTPQFKSINSFLLSLLHSPTLTFIHDRWKKSALKGKLISPFATTQMNQENIKLNKAGIENKYFMIFLYVEPKKIDS